MTSVRTEYLVRRLRRPKRAFTLLEVAVAMAIFVVMASVVSFSIAQSMTLQVDTRTDRVVSSALDGMLESVSNTNYDTLLQDAYQVPTPCLSDTNKVGSAAKSCLTLSNRSYQVTYKTLVGPDEAGSSTRTAAYVDVTASVLVPGHPTIQATRRVEAPTAGYSPDRGVVRVSLSGDTSDLTRLYLLSGGNDPRVVASGRPVGSELLIRAAAEACSLQAPCSLSTTPSVDGTGQVAVGVDTPDAVTSAGSIVLTRGAVTDATARVYAPAKSVVALQARSDAGVVMANPVQGSACIWGSFTLDGADRVQAYCNVGTSGQVTIDRFAPDPTHPERTLSLPEGLRVRLSVDAPFGGCPQAPGMTGATSQGWTPLATCTSWTWGHPATFTTDGKDTPAGEALLTVGKDAALTWSGAEARPATGYLDEGFWSKPRSSEACAATGTCTPAPIPAPEAAQCPGQHCLSQVNLAPNLTSPLQGSQRVPGVRYGTGSTPIVIGARDAEAQNITIILKSLPAQGVLTTTLGQPLTAGTILNPPPPPVDPLVPVDPLTPAPPAAVPGEAAASISYQAGGGVTKLNSFVLTLVDQNGTSRDVEVALYRQVAAWTLDAKEVNVTQGGKSEGAVTVTGTDGEPLATGSLAVSGSPSGLVVPATAPVTNGTARIALEGAKTLAGSYSLQVASTEGRSTSLPLRVTSVAGEVLVTGARIPQGGSADVSVKVKDLAGAPLSGVSAILDVQQDGKRALGAYPVVDGCVTGPEGCTLRVEAEDATKAGDYRVVAAVGGVTGSDTLQVTGVATRIVPEPFSVSQGEQGGLVAVVRDGSGDPAPNVKVTLAGDDKVSAPTSVTSDKDGRIRIPVTVEIDRVAGPARLQASLPGRKAEDLPLTVTPKLDSIIPQGVLKDRLTVVALDPNGKPVPGVVVEFTSLNGTKVSTKVTTGPNGQATTPLDGTGPDTITATSEQLRLVVNVNEEG